MQQSARNRFSDYYESIWSDVYFVVVVKSRNVNLAPLVL